MLSAWALKRGRRSVAAFVRLPCTVAPLYQTQYDASVYWIIRGV